MKKFFALILCVMLTALLGGCSLKYSEQAAEGAFSFAYGKKTAFVTEYRWDGTEEGMTVVIPEEYDGRKIVSVGGFFGRGLPMPFTVDIAGCFPEDAQWVSEPEAAADETVEWCFTLILPEGVEDVSAENSVWYLAQDGKIIAYRVCVNAAPAD